MTNTQTAPINVVLMNDTSSRYHHGCALVMRNLRDGLEARGSTILATSYARHDWQNDPSFIAKLRDAHLVVVNGEGTLHHGKDAGAALLKIVDRPELSDTPVALVNALYEANPGEWGRWLSKFGICAARDSVSLAAMKADMSHATSKPDMMWLPDLSMAQGARPVGGQRSGIIVGDSVKLNRRRDLAQLAHRLKLDQFIPTKTLRSPVWRMPVVRHLLYCAYNGVLQFRQPQFTMAADTEAYLAQLATCEGHITGRFHAVCLSMITRTPFLALSSNASKIERLLQDVGLGTDRLVRPDQLNSLTRADIVRPFSDQETQAIDAFLERARRESDVLFDGLAELAGGHLNLDNEEQK